MAHDVSIVVPVYQGAKTLDALVAEIAPLLSGVKTPGGNEWRVTELILVCDGATDGSAEVMERLASSFPFVRLVWLSRNFGQHAATIAGMASTVAPWVVTLDEDGQQDPRDVGLLLDEAIARRFQLVYAKPANPPPHGLFRNLASRIAKRIFVLLMGRRALVEFNSFRLMRGEIARGVAAYCGEGVFLDVALSWVVGGSASFPVKLRGERGRPSGYTYSRLVSHFWKLVLSSGTRPLRLVALAGVAAFVVGGGLSAYVLWRRATADIAVQGWASTIVVVCFFSGVILVSLGVIAEYLGMAVSMAIGKPPYLVVERPISYAMQAEIKERSVSR